MDRFNVEMDDAKWAKTKADLMLNERREALRLELNKRYCEEQVAAGTGLPQVVFDMMGAFGRAEHGRRVAARRAQNMSTR